ncbi:MAG: formyltransferase family protein [Candidatus Pacebacteria bacterium]|jgi:methionyl-tRNA formyltransferase|nr:formyltransferase family protein [Candidatus Paceibacterota bacterium]MDP7466455.1 formyltransferase family protein [Candidatus Paceibacterota bacterium]|tara:strand:+ start:1273 stop:1842 length:570 start_codon:yes stop_codon:yes gene_type:complete
MKILFLGQKDNNLAKYLRDKEESVISTEEIIDLGFLERYNPDFIVSYGYRHIIKKDILDLYNGRAINLHVSYLPWNKGADPNFWSLVENTPRGVTIHYLDGGVDTGDIIVQKEVEFTNNATLATSYEKLQTAIQELFKENWEAIKSGKVSRIKQTEKGTFHKVKEKEPLMHLLKDDWDTSISVLEEYNA